MFFYFYKPMTECACCLMVLRGVLNSNDKWHILMTVEDEGDLFFVNATEMTKFYCILMPAILFF